MSKFADVAGTAHHLSIAAMEEASRVGQRNADIDHLFIALVLNEQLAGPVLRSLGMTLDTARAAVAAQHAEQLAVLGVRADRPQPGTIVFAETNGYDWTDRALDLFKRASKRGKRGDAAAVLRELVVEPSGMIRAILGRLGTTPDAVIEGLDEAARYRDLPTSSPQIAAAPRGAAGRVGPLALGTTGTDPLSRSMEAFAPAPPEQVWELLSTPARMPNWDPSIGSVEDAPATIRLHDTWAAIARTTRADGKPISVKQDFIRQQVEVIALDHLGRIEWCFTYPEARRANARRVRIELEPAAGGTQLRLALVYERHPDRPRRSVLGLVFRSMVRLALWIQLSQLGSGISRAFR